MLSLRQRKGTLGLIINVYARRMRLPWLFDDLKLHFLAASTEERTVLASDEPVEADAWICMRTRELGDSPNLARTVVQVHDLYGDDYEQGKPRHLIRNAGAICFTHPEQPGLLARAGVKVKGTPYLVRPIGALRAFTCRKQLPEKFTVGIVGRPTLYRGLDVKRYDAVCDALIANSREPLRVVMVGYNLEPYAQRLRSHGIEVLLYERSHTPISAYPEIYHQMDCLVTYSEKEAGPMCLFEALASGVFVISSPTGWAEEMLDFTGSGAVVNSLSELDHALRFFRDRRVPHFENRESIVEEFLQDFPYRLEDWVTDNLDLAESLAR